MLQWWKLRWAISWNYTNCCKSVQLSIAAINIHNILTVTKLLLHVYYQMISKCTTFVQEQRLTSKIQHSFSVLLFWSIPPIVTKIGDTDPVIIVAAWTHLPIGHWLIGSGFFRLCQHWMRQINSLWLICYKSHPFTHKEEKGSHSQHTHTMSITHFRLQSTGIPAITADTRPLPLFPYVLHGWSLIKLRYVRHSVLVRDFFAT